MRTVVTYLDKDKNRTTKEKAWLVMTQIFNDAGNLQRTGYEIGAAQIRETRKGEVGIKTLSLRDQEGGGTLRVAKPMVKLGRDKGCDIVIDRAEVKKKIDKVHAALELRMGQWYVIDLSKGGVWVNERRIPASSPQPLKPGDILDLGGRQKYEILEE